MKKPDEPKNKNEQILVVPVLNAITELYKTHPEIAQIIHHDANTRRDQNHEYDMKILNIEELKAKTLSKQVDNHNIANKRSFFDSLVGKFFGFFIALICLSIIATSLFMFRYDVTIGFSVIITAIAGIIRAMNSKK
jgi:hypothetical protein